MIKKILLTSIVASNLLTSNLFAYNNNDFIVKLDKTINKLKTKNEKDIYSKYRMKYLLKMKKVGIIEGDNLRKLKKEITILKKNHNLSYYAKIDLKKYQELLRISEINNNKYTSILEKEIEYISGLEYINTVYRNIKEKLVKEFNFIENKDKNSIIVQIDKLRNKNMLSPSEKEKLNHLYLIVKLNEIRNSDFLNAYILKYSNMVNITDIEKNFLTKIIKKNKVLKIIDDIVEIDTELFKLFKIKDKNFIFNNKYLTLKKERKEKLEELKNENPILKNELEHLSDKKKYSKDVIINYIEIKLKLIENLKEFSNLIKEKKLLKKELNKLTVMEYQGFTKPYDNSSYLYNPIKINNSNTKIYTNQIDINNLLNLFNETPEELKFYLENKENISKAEKKQLSVLNNFIINNKSKTNFFNKIDGKWIIKPLPSNVNLFFMDKNKKSNFTKFKIEFYKNKTGYDKTNKNPFKYKVIRDNLMISFKNNDIFDVITPIKKLNRNCFISKYKKKLIKVNDFVKENFIFCKEEYILLYGYKKKINDLSEKELRILNLIDNYNDKNSNNSNYSSLGNSIEDLMKKEKMENELINDLLISENELNNDKEIITIDDFNDFNDNYNSLEDDLTTTNRNKLKTDNNEDIDDLIVDIEKPEFNDNDFSNTFVSNYMIENNRVDSNYNRIKDKKNRYVPSWIDDTSTGTLDTNKKWDCSDPNLPAYQACTLTIKQTGNNIKNVDWKKSKFNQNTMYPNVSKGGSEKPSDVLISKGF